MSRFTTTAPLQSTDFKDPCAVEELIGFRLLSELEEIEVEVIGHVNPYRPATFNGPAEGGGVEDLEVIYDEHNLTEHLTAKAVGHLETLLREEAAYG